MKLLLLILSIAPLFAIGQVNYTVTVTRLKALADPCDGGIPPFACPAAPQDPVYNVWSNDAEANEETYCWVFDNDDDAEYGLWTDIPNVEIAAHNNVMSTYVTFDMKGFESDDILSTNCTESSGDDEFYDRQFVGQYTFTDFPQMVPYTTTLDLGGVYFMEIEIEWQDSNASIDDIENNLSFVLAPNPNNGIFSVNLAQDDNSTFDVTVVDLMGRVVYQEMNLMNKAEINLMNQDAGSYFVQVEKNGHKTVRSVVLK